MSYKVNAKKRNLKLPAPRLHMVFMGNPGTGKTTTAQKFADILFKNHMIETRKIRIVERKDFIGPEGPERRTEKIIQEALDGVLFIDEAYTLTNKESDPTGELVIETLLTAMEQYRDRLVIIFAGYTNEMQEFLNVNPGIDSRTAYKIYFDTLDTDRLKTLYIQKMRSFGYDFNLPKIGTGPNAFQPNPDNMEKVLTKLTGIMEYYSAAPNFGNARFVDLLIDRTIQKKATRTSGDTEMVRHIHVEDIPTIDELMDTLPQGYAVPTNAEILQYRERTAIHEVGHYVTAVLLDAKPLPEKISIRPNAVSNGRNIVRNPDINTRTEGDLMNELTILLGGRNAEKLLLGSHGPGCSGDYAKAKALAKRMVENWAMGTIGVTKPEDLLMEADKRSTELLLEHQELLIKVKDQLSKSLELQGRDLDALCVSLITCPEEEEAEEE